MSEIEVAMKYLRTQAIGPIVGVTPYEPTPATTVVTSYDKEPVEVNEVLQGQITPEPEKTNDLVVDSDDGKVLKGLVFKGIDANNLGDLDLGERINKMLKIAQILGYDKLDFGNGNVIDLKELGE